MRAADSTPPALPDAPRPITWQGDGAGPSMREQTASAMYRPAPARRNAEPAGVTVRGRMHGRQLITLTCTTCGADLLPSLAEVLVRGCPCTRRPALRRIS
jgi:hypothetical protein